MAQAVFSSPIRMIKGETVSLTTTASHVAIQPMSETDGGMQYLLYCPTQFRMAIAPRLASCKKLVGTTYTDYTSAATDRVATTDVVLDGMTTATWLYIGVTGKTRGFYFTMDATNKNDNAATLDWEYCYDIAGAGYKTLTGTVTGALTVGETVTGSVSGATATLVYSGAASIVVKNIVGRFALGEDADGGAQACNVLTAIDYTAQGTGYFTDVAGDNDGTDVGGDTLKQSGLYRFTLPAVVKGAVTSLSNEPLYWYRFAPSATLSAATQVNEIIPAAADTSYGYLQGGQSYQLSINTDKVGAFEFVHTGTDTLNLSRIMH